MRGICLLVCLAGLCVSVAKAATSTLIEADLGRTEGVFTKSPVYERAILVEPKQPTDTALLYFRGYPGIEKIESVKGHPFTPPFMRYQIGSFLSNGIALVLMDCPTDQWNSCEDSYRSSQQHADDVRSVMKKLREEHGITRFYIMGHSMGSVSSRWLAVNLGDEIAGSIHSGSMNLESPSGFASSAWNIPYDRIKAPVLYVHNEHDGCEYTPYSKVKAYAGENLVTVRGGNPDGNPCRVHLHSYDGRGEEVVGAIIKWIKTGEVERFVGEP